MTEQRLSNNLFNVSLTILQLPLLQQSCGLLVGEFPSMSSQQKDTLPVPSQHFIPLEQLTF